MMKRINFEELKRINGGGSVFKGPDSQKKTVGWPNGWDVAEAGPLATCDPPC